MAVASDLPQIENRQQYKHELANSYLYDDHWRPIGLFAPPNNVVIDQYGEISPSMQDAIVAIEDKRFWTDPGVDIRGIARAFVADVTGGSRQGASTIAQQFVKNALSEQDNRTIFEKLREAALAYHLTREWPKQKILTEYLNSIYFGNGAYGVESAARVYFGKRARLPTAIRRASDTPIGGRPSRPGLRRRTTRRSCPSARRVLTPWEAALLAGHGRHPERVRPGRASGGGQGAAQPRAPGHAPAALHHARPVPTQGIDAPLPTAPGHPAAAGADRRAVLHELAAAADPRRDGARPRRPGERRRVPRLLRRAEDPHDARPQAAAGGRAGDLAPSSRPASSLPERVAGRDRQQDRRGAGDGRRPDRQRRRRTTPSSRSTSRPRATASPARRSSRSRSPMALESGEYGPDSVIDSAPQDFIVPNSGGKEHFIVHNFGNTYSGPITLAAATDDLRQHGVRAGRHPGTGTHRRSRSMAKRMGIRSPVSNNYAMILGGLKVGVSPLDMAHAYETFAEGGRRVFNPELGAPRPGPDRDRPDPLPDASARAQDDRRQADVQADPPGRRSRRPSTTMLDRAWSSHGTGTERRDLGRRRRRQDRHDHQLRRRLVRRLDAADDDRGLGRLPEQARVDGHRLQRRPGRGRHLPGDHLAQLHGAGAADPRHREARQEAGHGTTTTGTTGSAPARRSGLGRDGADARRTARGDHAGGDGGGRPAAGRRRRRGGGGAAPAAARDRGRWHRRRRPAAVAGTGGGTRWWHRWRHRRRWRRWRRPAVAAARAAVGSGGGGGGTGGGSAAPAAPGGGGSIRGAG